MEIYYKMISLTIFSTGGQGFMAVVNKPHSRAAPSDLVHKPLALCCKIASVTGGFTIKLPMISWLLGLRLLQLEAAVRN